jgi:pantoate kinase
MAASHQFATDVGLLTDELAAIIEDVNASGGQASMAMLGETVFALGTDLSDAGYDPAVTAIHRPGATII